MHYGLDFGTTNSVIAVKEKNTNEVEVIPVDPLGREKEKLMRSLLYIRKKTKEKFVGGRAVKEYLYDSRTREPVRFKTFATGETTTILIPGSEGSIRYTADVTYREDINKPGQLIQALKTSLREGFDQKVDLFGEKFLLEDLIAVVLLEMKKTADKYLGKNITRVTLGRPVHYSEKDADKETQERMKKAAQLAGFKSIKFLPEPVAAAYDYLESRVNVEDKCIFVFDFGGGTLDFCLMRRKQGKPEILATDGLSIGGDLFNELIMLSKVSPYFGTELIYGPKKLPMPAFIKGSLQKWYEVQSLKSPELRSFLQTFKHETENPKLIQNLITLIDYDLSFELFEAIEKAKVELSLRSKTIISFHKQGINLKIPITRKEFEKIIAPQVEVIEVVVENLLKKARKGSGEIDVVVCTGGVSYTPIVQKRLRQIFEKSEIVYHNVFQGIAAGLARI